MCNQDIRVRRDFVPNLRNRLTTVHIEAPIAEPRLPGGSVDVYTVQCNGFVFDVRAVGEQAVDGNNNNKVT